MSPPSDGSTSPSPAITRGISPKPSRPKRSGRCEPRLQCSQPEFALRSHERGIIIKCTFVTRPHQRPNGGRRNRPTTKRGTKGDEAVGLLKDAGSFAEVDPV